MTNDKLPKYDSKRRSVHFGNAQWRDLAAIAKRQQRNLSAVIREAVGEYIRRDGNRMCVSPDQHHLTIADRVKMLLAWLHAKTDHDPAMCTVEHSEGRYCIDPIIPFPELDSGPSVAHPQSAEAVRGLDLMRGIEDASDDMKPFTQKFYGKSTLKPGVSRQLQEGMAKLYGTAGREKMDRAMDEAVEILDAIKDIEVSLVPEEDMHPDMVSRLVDTLRIKNQIAREHMDDCDG